MKVITISRLYGSGGEDIAQRLCRDLGYRLLDKHLIAQAAAEAGVTGDASVDHFEEHAQAKGFRQRIGELLLGSSAGSVSPRQEAPTITWGGLETRIDENWMVKLVEETILDSYTQGSVVILGRGGQVILRDKPDVLHVRVVAPLPARVQRIQQQENLTERAARQRLDMHDQGSARYIRRFFNVDWEDATLYHLVLNTGYLSYEAAAALVSDAAQQVATPA